MSGLAADRGAVRVGHGHRTGRRGADRDVRATARGVLGAVVNHRAIPGDHEAHRTGGKSRRCADVRAATWRHSGLQSRRQARGRPEPSPAELVTARDRPWTWEGAQSRVRPRALPGRAAGVAFSGGVQQGSAERGDVGRHHRVLPAVAPAPSQARGPVSRRSRVDRGRLRGTDALCRHHARRHPPLRGTRPGIPAPAGRPRRPDR